MTTESMISIVKHLQRTRERLMADNDNLFNETIRYRNERETYHFNPTTKPERPIKEDIADRMFKHYQENLNLNNLFLDEIETEMGEWIQQIDEDISLDDFIAVYLT